MTLPRRLYLLVLIPALLALLAAAWAGLVRMGWALPPFQVAGHGPLMISGFLGALICLERAVALASAFNWGRMTLAVPALAALGTLAILVGVPGWPGPLLITFASAGLTLMFARILRDHHALFTATMALGALAWLVGNLLWLLGAPLSQLVHWWVGFLVLTIAGERLELSRVTRLSSTSYQAFGLALALFLGGIVITLFAVDIGVRIAGVGKIALALWLLRHDIARRTIRQAGLTRFIAACLLLGYVWLTIGGILAIWSGAVTAGFFYDAELHTILLGFVFSMIFGHAPIILPALTGLTMEYHRRFYLHLALLHLSLLLRILGDLTILLPARQWGGLLNVVALLLFLANTATSVKRSETTAAS
jgi:hypothetical protein